MKSIKITLLLSAIVMLFAVACKKDRVDEVGETTSLSVRLTDAPGCFDAVYINLREVIIHYVGGKEVLLNTFSGMYNVVALLNGVDTLIASGNLPSGQIESVRLKIGDNNTAIVDGITYQLPTPGIHHPGLKIPVSKNLATGSTNEILLDFDLFRSVIYQGGTSYLFSPVIRFVDKTLHGSVSGSVYPVTAISSISVESNGNRYASFSNVEGYFMVQGIPSGTYTVTVTPDPPLVPAVIQNITVQAGTNKNLGTINF